MGESRRKKQRGHSATPDYILKHTEKGLIASMEEAVAQAKALALAKNVGQPKAFGLFERGYGFHEILELSMWVDEQDCAIQVLVRQSETGKFVTLNHAPATHDMNK